MMKFLRLNSISVHGIGLLLLWASVLSLYAAPTRFEPYEPGERA